MNTRRTIALLLTVLLGLGLLPSLPGSLAQPVDEGGSPGSPRPLPSGLGLPRPNIPGYVWRTEIVVDHSTQWTSLKLDAAGRPHIIFSDQTEQALYHAYKQGATWSFEMIDDEIYAHSPSLAFDSAGYPHVSYSTGERDLVYAYFDGASWQVELVDGAPDAAEHTSLALDQDDRPHIAYGYDDLRYAYHDGDSWQIEVLDAGYSGAFFGAHTSLALDQDGRPHISYRGHYHIGSDYPYLLRYAYHDGAAWQFQTVDDSDITMHGGYTSLALDGEGRPHISYFHYVNADVQYAYYDGSNWHLDPVDDGSGGYDHGTSLVLDSLYRPHVCYYDGSPRYAYLDGGIWHAETVDDSVPNLGDYCSLDLDENDLPRLSYIRAGGAIAKLHYAWPEETPKVYVPFVVR